MLGMLENYLSVECGEDGVHLPGYRPAAGLKLSREWMTTARARQLVRRGMGGMISPIFGRRYAGLRVAFGIACLSSASAAAAQTTALPVQVLESPSIASPVDHRFTGMIELDV